MEDKINKGSAVDESFLFWCASHGAIVGPIHPTYVPLGWRGIVAKETIPAETCVLSIPKKLLLTCESANKDEDLRSAIRSAAVESISSLQLLALHLLHEHSKGTESFWYPYLCTLPMSYTTAVCFDEVALEALQVPSARGKISYALNSVNRMWKSSAKVLENLKGIKSEYITLHRWLWALSTLSSRTMHLQCDPAGALMPIGDLHNYAPPPPPVTPNLFSRAHEGDAGGEENAAIITGDGRFDEVSQSYQIYVRQQYAAGEEVLLCYGRYSNLELLEHYGFVLEDNPHDFASIPHQYFPKSVQHQLDSLGCHAILHANGNPSFEFLRALRFASLTPSERKKSSYLVLEDRSVNSQSETWVLKTLQRSCEEYLDSFVTTLQQDMEILAFQAPQGNEHCVSVAIAWRIQHKRIVCQTVKACAARIGADQSPGLSAGTLPHIDVRRPKLPMRRAEGPLP